MKDIKSVLFRIFCNLPLGFIFLKILEYMNSQLCLNQIDMQSIFGISCIYFLPSWFWAILYISILLLVGEIVSTLGEWLISWLFEFPAFGNKKETNLDDKFEKITPCGESYLTNEKLIIALTSKGGVDDFSELHFALSRLLAGAAWLCLLLLVNKEWWLVFLPLVAIIFAILIMKCCTKWNCTSFLMLIMSLGFIVILATAKYSNCFDLMYPILFILTFILLFAACIYRSVANVINFSAGSNRSSRTFSEFMVNSCEQWKKYWEQFGK